MEEKKANPIQSKHIYKNVGTNRDLDFEGEEVIGSSSASQSAPTLI
jgi:hypothetical protein